MADRSVRIRVLDMLAEIGNIEQMLDGKTLAGYRGDLVTKRATERCLEIISEASRHVPDAMQARHPEIPWHKVRAIGNVLRHEYGRVEDDVLWNVTQDHLPDLKRALTSMLAELPEETDEP